MSNGSREACPHPASCDFVHVQHDLERARDRLAELQFRGFPWALDIHSSEGFDEEVESARICIEQQEAALVRAAASYCRTVFDAD